MKKFKDELNHRDSKRKQKETKPGKQNKMRPQKKVKYKLSKHYLEEE